jgi:hypothetical protein
MDWKQIKCKSSRMNWMFITVQYCKCVCMAFERTFNKSVVNFYLCKWCIKKTYKWKYRLSKGGDLKMDNLR